MKASGIYRPKLLSKLSSETFGLLKICQFKLFSRQGSVFTDCPVKNKRFYDIFFIVLSFLPIKLSKKVGLKSQSINGISLSGQRELSIKSSSFWQTMYVETPEPYFETARYQRSFWPEADSVRYVKYFSVHMNKHCACKGEKLSTKYCDYEKLKERRSLSFPINK